MYFSISSPNSTSTLRVHMENLDCKQSAQSWVSFLVHLLFYITMDDLKHLINKEIFKIYYHTMYLKLMFVRLKWYHWETDTDLITHGIRGRMYKEKHLCFLKQNKLCMFGFSSYVPLQKVFLPLPDLRAGLALMMAWGPPAESEHQGFCRREDPA